MAPLMNSHHDETTTAMMNEPLMNQVMVNERQAEKSNAERERRG
jgi:hypothetical protein